MTPSTTSTRGSRRRLVPLEKLDEASECLRTLAHPHRLRMVEMTLDREAPVGELAEACGIEPAQASGHLRLMKDRGLMRARREGRNIYYTVAEPGLRGILDCIRHRFG